MKKKILLVLNSTLLITTLCACPNNNKQTRYLPASIKSVWHYEEGDYLDETFYEYDEDLLGYTETVYETFNGKKEITSKDIKRFSKDSNYDLEIYYRYENGVLDYCDKYETIREKNKLTEKEYSLVDINNENSFVETRRYIYSYNDSNNLTKCEYYSLNDSDVLFKGYEYIYEYDSKGSISKETGYSYSKDLEKYLIDGESRYQYLTNGDIICEDYIFEFDDQGEIKEAVLIDKCITNFYRENGLNYRHESILNNEKNFEETRNEFWWGSDSNGNCVYYKGIIRDFDGKTTSIEEKILGFKNKTDLSTFTVKFDNLLASDSVFTYDSKGRMSIYDEIQYDFGTESRRMKNELEYNKLGQIVGYKTSYKEIGDDDYRILAYEEVTLSQIVNDDLLKAIGYEEDILDDFCNDSRPIEMGHHI